jgi:hypothetical protein
MVGFFIGVCILLRYVQPVTNWLSTLTMIHYNNKSESEFYLRQV